jgi:hypothetical protein
MIKIQNNIATRDPIPAFLQGLALESLADLSWTDPALGVSDAAWWPEEDASPALAQYERYGDETLTVADGVVIVNRAVVSFTQDEIAAAQAEANRQAVAQVQRQRAAEYPPMTDYIDGIVKGDQAQVQAYIDACLAVKAKYPKPE